MFKVGDRVKIMSYPHFGETVGEVIEIKDNGCYPIIVNWEGNCCGYCAEQLNKI